MEAVYDMPISSLVIYCATIRRPEIKSAPNKSLFRNCVMRSSKIMEITGLTSTGFFETLIGYPLWVILNDYAGPSQLDVSVVSKLKNQTSWSFPAFFRRIRRHSRLHLQPLPSGPGRMIVLAHPEDSILIETNPLVYRWPVPEFSSQCFLSLWLVGWCPQAAPLLDRVICSGNKTLFSSLSIHQSGFMAMIFRHYYC